MGAIHFFLEHLRHTLSALAPWWPVLAAATLVEVLKPGKKLHWPTVIANCIYMPLGLTLGALVAAKVFTLAEPYIPADITHLRAWADTPAKTVLLWLVYLVVFDLLYYCLHRAQHQVPWLWRFHMVHHSDTNTSATTVGRHHWLEEFFRLFIITWPLIFLMGGTSNMPLWVSLFMLLNGIFMHWNVAFRFGALEKYIITPAYHRIHHSIEERHYDKNFGVFTQLWDYVFATRYLPQPHEYPETGISGLSSTRSWALVMPWPVDLSKSPKSISVPSSAE